jgi:phage-related protein
MAKKRNIGATLSLKEGNFFVNIKKATSELGGLKKSSASAMGSLKKLGGVVSTVGKGFLTASATGVAAMTGLTVKSLDLAGELEQNIGGSEAVFASFAKTLQDKAAGAFETLGLSMSDYLATANKMGALFQGSGFTIEESLNMTTSAMQRAADVASIMGIDVDAAMEAVAGAAKGNFTMMDNLGVAINDTSIKAYAAAKGIKTMGKTMTTQEKVGIAMQMFLEKTAYAAGNYAKENDTLAGSINTAKAAFKTFMSGAGSAEGIASAFINVAKVVSRKVGELLPTLTRGLSEIIKQLSPKIPELLQSVMPEITTGAMSLVNGLAQMLPSIIGVLTDSLPTLLPMLITGFTEVIKKIAVAITTNAPALLSGIGEGIKSSLMGTNLESVGNILGSTLGGLGNALTGILNAATSVYNFFVNNWGVLSPIIAGITASVIAWKVAMAAANAVQTIAIALNKSQKKEIVAMTFSQQLQAIMTGMQTAATTAFNTVQAITNALFVASPIGWIILAIGALVAISVALWKNWDAVCNGIKTAWEWLKTTAVNIWSGIADFFVAYWPWILGIFTGGIGLVIGYVIQNWNSIKAKTAEIWNAVKEIFSKFWTNIKETFTSGVNKIKELWEGLKNFLKNPIKGVVKLFKRTDEDGDGYIDGSHAGGLPNVPFDGYIAKLHKGERVLTAAENRNYSKGQGGTTTYNNDIKIYINASGKSADEVVNEIVPKLKLALANM